MYVMMYQLLIQLHQYFLCKLKPNLSLYLTNIIFHRYSTVTSLGETAVSFDFGQQIVVERKNEKLSLLEIYILKGNGDVLLLLANLYDHRFAEICLIVKMFVNIRLFQIFLFIYLTFSYN